MKGQWRYVGDPATRDGYAEVLAVHAALLPTGQAGQIVYFGGSQWVYPQIWGKDVYEDDPNLHSNRKYADGKTEIDHSRIYDCDTQKVTNPTSPDADLFCSGHALLPDGRVVIGGGTDHYPLVPVADPHHGHWSGSRDTWIFDPYANPHWVKGQPLNRDPQQHYVGQPMGGGRWYPTLITLPSGQAIAMCGHPLVPRNVTPKYAVDSDIRHNNTKPELFDPAIGVWTLIDKALGVDGAPNYLVIMRV